MQAIHAQAAIALFYVTDATDGITISLEHLICVNVSVRESKIAQDSVSCPVTVC